MKKELLAGTALAGSAALIAGVAIAAEAPTWKLTGNANFQFYWVDQGAGGLAEVTWDSETWDAHTWRGDDESGTWQDVHGMSVYREGTGDAQDHDWYFGVDEAELQLNVSGVADNGLNYGFKIEINANTTDETVVDEARLQLSGGWGTLQLGDEDGAEDIMNYGGESLMGATGGFDGDQDDYLYRAGGGATMVFHGIYWSFEEADTALTALFTVSDDAQMNLAAPSYPTIAGDTSDRTKVSYFSPRFSGFQVGASITPTPNNGDDFKADGDWENHIGIGANYDNSFGDLRIRASAVYSMRTNAAKIWLDGANRDLYNDVGAFSVGGIVGWGPFSLGANYTDNGDSGQPLVYDGVAEGFSTAPIETSYWNVAAGFEPGPMYFSVGYFSSLLELGNFGESTYNHLALTADYTMAPGLGVYAEINMISDELLGSILNYAGQGGPAFTEVGYSMSNDTTSLIMGMNISF